MSQAECPIQVGNTLTVTLTVRDCKTDAVIDVSSAIAVGTKTVKIKGPRDGLAYTEEATFVTDGTNGEIRATFIAGKVNAIGDWKAQGFVNITAGKFKTSITEFEVIENI